MGISNLKVGLGRKFASWSGERIQLEREIAKINEMVALLDQKRKRVGRLNTLIECACEIMASGLVPVSCRSAISLCHLGFERERADAAQI